MCRGLAGTVFALRVKSTQSSWRPGRGAVEALTRLSSLRACCEMRPGLPPHTCCPENRLEERFVCKWFSAATREEEGYLLDFVKERVKCMLFACPVPLIPGRGRSPGRGALLPAGMCWSPGSLPLGLTDVPISQRARDAASGLGHAAHRTGRGPVLPVSVRVRSQLFRCAPTPICLHQSSTGPGTHGPSQKRVIPSRGLTFLNLPWGGEV